MQLTKYAMGTSPYEEKMTDPWRKSIFVLTYRCFSLVGVNGVISQGREGTFE